MKDQSQHPGHGHDHDHEHGQQKELVTVFVDGDATQVERGDYQVSAFKVIVGVDASRGLSIMEHGHLRELDDSEHIHIKGGEKFVSHERTGAAS